jgi:hypothetical protein
MNRQYDNHGKDQINIENIYLNKTISGQEFLTRGLQLLSQKNYQQAINKLSDAIISDPSLSDAYYYLAMASLKGNKPRRLDVWTIRDIEENLNTAIAGNSKNSRYYTLWAIIKYGYYTMNSLLEKSPSSDNLFKKGETIQAEHAREILYYVNDPSNLYWIKLYNQFKKLY